MSVPQGAKQPPHKHEGAHRIGEQVPSVLEGQGTERQVGWIALCGDDIVVQEHPIEGHDDAVEFMDELPPRWPGETDPGCRVEYFLEDNAELLKDCADAWHQVAADQAEFSTVRMSARQKLSRERRRENERKFGGMNMNNVYGLIKGNGQKNLGLIRHGQKDTPYAAMKACVGLFYQNLNKEIAEEMEKQGAAGPEADMQRLIFRQGESYSRAYLASDESLSRIESLLSDDETAKVFLKKVSEMAADSDTALTAHPGLIELLATHILQAGESNNMLRSAVLRTAPEPQAYSKEYLDQQVDGDGSKGKEINAIVGVINLLSTIVKQDYNANPDDIRRRMAEHVNEWPVDLRNGLEVYARVRAQDDWVTLRDVLTPYTRQGRLPLSKGIEFSAESQKRSDSTPAGARSSRRRMPTVNLGAKDQDHEQVAQPQEIEHFAVVGSRIKRDKFNVEPVDTLEELYELSGLADYAREHAEDDSLPALFMAALEHLTTNPYDKSCVEKLKNVEYELDGDPRQSTRRPYRFKPQSFPGVKKGEIANATRIIFDVVTLEGQRTLVIYGAFHKQQIDGMNKLPSRS